ncbi:MAG: FAD-binding protein [Proteobacteria bacterium]|nr:MAG: FAD-binding protein [Pseudomonadota bacterium]QKK12364.1 MAG: GMC family oxidoreductase [Pseudomonadota bacterium]
MTEDMVAAGLRSGWQVRNGSALTADHTLEADVVIVGSGAGGGTAAEILAASGLRVLLVEEGPLKSSREFRMREADAYPQLYQESAARKTRDKAINILQGRCVGGSTTVNWTSCFRTPPETLAYWRSEFGLADLDGDALAPWFERMEQQLGIETWSVPANENNDLLRRGAEKLGISTATIPRNVKGCLNLGYCGLGCPTNAKQSMLVTTIPAALSSGAALWHRLRAERLVLSGGRAVVLECLAMEEAGIRPLPYRVRIHAKHFVLAAGSLGTPALLMRSDAPDPHGHLGKRTFLHPTTISAGQMDGRVDGYAGAPQSVYSNHFLDNVPLRGPMGFKLEVPPLHPVLFSTTLQGFGTAHAQQMQRFANTHVVIALLRDGFNPGSPGGTVHLQSDGTPVLDYPITEFVWEGVRRSWLAMAEIQFAAGAKRVTPVHEKAGGYASWKEVQRGIQELPLTPNLARVVSAHVMGGCGMAASARDGVADSFGRHHQLDNVSICDGSLFPTSVGTNPQLSIYGLAARNASRLATDLAVR